MADREKADQNEIPHLRVGQIGQRGETTDADLAIVKEYVSSREAFSPRITNRKRSRSCRRCKRRGGRWGCGLHWRGRLGSLDCWGFLCWLACLHQDGNVVWPGLMMERYHNPRRKEKSVFACHVMSWRGPYSRLRSTPGTIFRRLSILSSAHHRTIVSTLNRSLSATTQVPCRLATLLRPFLSPRLLCCGLRLLAFSPVADRPIRGLSRQILARFACIIFTTTPPDCALPGFPSCRCPALLRLRLVAVAVPYPGRGGGSPRPAGKDELWSRTAFNSRFTTRMTRNSPSSTHHPRFFLPTLHAPLQPPLLPSTVTVASHLLEPCLVHRQGPILGSPSPYS